MIKLNLGCGTDIREGWINIDSYERSNGTVNMDITKLTYENNYADEICARDVLEHVTHRKTMDVLREWYRVLKPGGKIYIQVPNMMGWALALVYHKCSDECVAEHLYAHQDYPTNFHYAGFTIPMLSKMMQEVGFKNIESISEDRSEIKTEQDTNIHLWANK